MSNEVPVVLRIKGAAKMLNISERHLWNLSKKGEIPHRRVGTGKRIICLYSVAELNKWLVGANSCNG